MNLILCANSSGVGAALRRELERSWGGPDLAALTPELCAGNPLDLLANLSEWNARVRRLMSNSHLGDRVERLVRDPLRKLAGRTGSPGRLCSP